MHVRILLGWLLLTVAGVADDPARMDVIARAYTAGDRFMGSVLVARDGAVVFERSYGRANLEWDVANTPDTRFRIGSITKQITAAAVLLLEQDGKLTTGDRLTQYIPDAPEAWQAITLHQLLTHTSGIPSFTGLPDYEQLKRGPLNFDLAIARLRGLPLEYPPGEKHAYSNSGYLLLGYVIEKVSGQRYAAFLQERIFGPLGMKDTGQDSNVALLPRRAAGYTPGSSGLVNAAYINMEVPHAAGALYSTPRDLLRWTEALFGGRVLSAASLEKMLTPVKADYACGIVVNTVNGRRLVSHAGSIDGFNSQLSYYPDTKTTVVVLANVNGSAASKLAGQLGELAHGGTVTLAAER